MEIRMYDAAYKYGLSDMSVTPALEAALLEKLGTLINTSINPSGQIYIGQTVTATQYFSGGYHIRDTMVFYTSTSGVVTSRLSYRTDTDELLSSSIGNMSFVSGTTFKYETILAGIDKIFGNAYNNLLSGYGGNDTINGGTGLDTVVFSGTRASHTMSWTPAGWSASSPADGTDTLINIERLQFSDKSLAFDIAGNAGQVYRLYQAAFNRTPDKAGLGDWIYGMDHDGVSLLGVSAGFINSAEFASVYGANPTTAEIVTRFYQNVLHRAPEQAGFDYWMNQIDSGVQTRTQVLTGFSESPENQAQIIGVIQNGIEYTQHQI